MPGQMNRGSSSSKVMGEDEDEFNQGIILPPLIIQLRKILDQYPDDTQILKELIQNAEDAGAKEVKFLYDRHTFGQDPRYLHHPDLADFQGPALYAFNDALFSESDWKGIRMLSQSVKQNDPFKVGYFGLGFKSVFHLTDLPCMLSGDKLGLIDPHQQILTASSHGWNIAKRPDLLSSLPHQLEPFLGVFNCDAAAFRAGFYNGTLFRFPLRSKASPLSSVLYSHDKIQALMQSFQQDAHLILLFLKNLERIALYDRDKHAKNPSPIFKVELSPDCIDEVRAKRAEFVAQVRSAATSSSGPHDRTIISTYTLTINTEAYTDRGTVRCSYRYLVTNHYCGGSGVSPVFRNLFRDPELGFLPWVGTAMRIDVKDSKDPEVYQLTDHDGRIFCFLPLPSEQHVSTGLPVHVHGFFALEQNRKYIKWPASHRMPDVHMDKGLVWNQCMLREALPKAYAHMLREAIRMHSSAVQGSSSLSVQSIYRAMPDLARIERRWESIVALLYADVITTPLILYQSPSQREEWLDFKAAVFNTLDRADEATPVIMQVLDVSSVRMVDVPEHVLVALKKYCHFNLAQISASLVAAALKEVQCTLTMQWDIKMKLLRYFLKQSKFELLDGLDLLPLANGGFERFHFNAKHAERPIYVAPSDEMQGLLPGLKDDFLESDIDPDILQLLVKASQRGYTQLRVLDAPLVGTLLPRCLPAGWTAPRGGAGAVEWNPREPGHPPEQWLEALWLFMARCSPRDLSTVEGLPILPGRTLQRVIGGRPQTITELLPLSSSSVSITRMADGLSLGADVEEIVLALGIAVVDALPDYVKAHPLVAKLYIFSPTYLGVLRAIERKCAAEGRDVIVRRILTDTSAQQKRSLRALLAKISVYEIQRDCQELLALLPLFETTAGSGGGRDPHFVSAVKVNISAPSPLPFPVSRLLLDLTAGDSQALARLLGVKVMGLAALLTQIVFPDIEAAFYEHGQVQAIMLYVLKHYQSLVEADKVIRKTLRTLAFLPKGDMLLTPDRFYDPDQGLLQKLFLFEENFPVGAYSDPSTLTVLREVGLRGVEDVEPEDLQEAAFTVQNLYSSTDPTKSARLVEKSDALLAYLERQRASLRAPCAGSTLAEVLANISWVRALPARPPGYPAGVPWGSRQNGAGVFYRPSEMAGRAYASVCGAIMPIVAAEVTAPEVLQAFGWHTPPPLDVIIEHLSLVVSTQVAPQDKPLLADLTRSIYTELSRLDVDDVRAALRSGGILPEWIWHGDGFARVEVVSIAPPFMDLRPYAFALPRDLGQCQGLFEGVGVPRACSLTGVLVQIKQKYDEHELTSSSRGGVAGQLRGSSASQPRGSGSSQPRGGSTSQAQPVIGEAEMRRDLHLCVCILNEVKGRVGDSDWLEQRDQLVLPVDTGVPNALKLIPIAECTYTDDESLRQGHSKRNSSTSSVSLPVPPDDSLTLVHSAVPNATLEALGVPTLLSRMLEAEELDYSFRGGGHQLGSLTDRLRACAAELSGGLAVPRELIQNADDAGATEVRFLYDERTNADALTSLVDEGMRECHGPALWVYNDAVFSDADFENIARLGGATKESQLDKIGRSGLGFTSVYNITDVPSFVSRHSIVIFDPHTTHLGRSIRDKMKPALRLDMRRHRRKMKGLANQFKPYNEVFGCDLRKEEPYGGTLFRLPLRTRQQAARSLICRKQCDDRDIRELLRQLVESAESLLLFTQSVRRISIHHIPRGATSPSDLHDLFRADKKLVRVLRELTPAPPGVSAGSDPDYERLIRQTSLLRSCAESLRALRKGGARPDRQGLPDSTMILNVDKELTAKGGAVLHGPPLVGGAGRGAWLVACCMGRGDSLKMAMNDGCLIPAAAVAVQLESTPVSESYKPVAVGNSGNSGDPQGAVFAWLPLQTRARVPVHISAAFILSPDRRGLHEAIEDDKSDSRSRWNATLMADAVSLAYVRLLADIATFFTPPPSGYDFSALWPNLDYASAGECEPLVGAFYREVCSRAGWAVFSNGQRWATIDNVIFLECSTFREASVVQAAMEVCRQGPSASKMAVVVPDFVRRGLLMAPDGEKAVTSRTFDEAGFYEKMLMPNIGIVGRDARDALVIHALRQNNATLDKCISEHRCIPALVPDGSSSPPQLRKPAELVDPKSSIAKLYSTADERFPSANFTQEDVLNSLRGLGMKRGAGDVSWEEYAERVRGIASGAGDRRGAGELATAALAVLGEKLSENVTSANLRAVQQQLVDTRFIPAMTKPRRFPLHWKGGDGSDGSVSQPILFRPAELFPPECRDLVGCVQYIADPGVFPRDSQDVLNFLRLGMEWKEPSVAQVLEQLDVLSNPETENYLHDRDLQEEIQKMCYGICAFLQQKCGTEPQRQALREALGSRYFILADNRFLSPKQVALSFPHNCAPHLFALPEYYRRNFSELFAAVGVREHFDAKDFVYALQSMHDVYLNEPLDRDSLKLALQLVNLLNERMADTGLTTAEVVGKYGAIYVPDARNVLYSATDLCYSEADTHWVASPASPKASSSSSPAARASSPPAGFTHPLIPYAMSRQLGVSTRRPESAEYTSPRGSVASLNQRETMASQLKRILTGYPSDKEILKELLQRADDSGVTELQFVKDPRQHGTDRLFDQSYRPLQGPALCVFNNQPMTEADMDAIKNLVRGVRGMDPNRTGQYGIGFSCVYHITDAPSFLSKSRELGETLCVFDPHGKFVPGATSDEPIKCFDDVGKLRAKIPDVFSGYLEDKINFTSGTVFRFPLRNDKMATESELSEKPVSVEFIDNMFTRFKQEIFDCLLFVNNVEKITLGDVENRSNGLINSYSVTTEISAEDQAARREFSEFVKSVTTKLQTNKISLADIPIREVTYIVTLTDSKKTSEKWMVSQRMGIDRTVKIHPSISDAVKSGELALLPRGGVAALIDSSDSECNRRASKAFCFLPLPVKVDLPVHVNGHFALDHEARRSLWPDDDAGCKSEWNHALVRHVIAPAYTTLLRRIAPHLSTSMLAPGLSLMDALGDEVPTLDTYCQLFPQLGKQTPPGYWRNLVEAVYRRIHQLQEPVLPVARPHGEQFGGGPSLAHLESGSGSSQSGGQVEVEWLPTGSDGLRRPCFDNIKESFRETEESRSGRGTTPTRRRRSRSSIRRPSHEVLRHVLLSSGFKLIKLPFEIYEGFVEAGVSVGCVTPRGVIDFYASYGSRSPACVLPRLPADISTTPFRNDTTLKVVHEYCSQDIPHFRGNLNGLPLLLCEDDKLRVFSTKDRVYMSAHHEILPGLNAAFIHHVLVGSIFKDADIESCDVFKRFDIKALAGLLPNVLSAEYNSKSGSSSTYVKWNVESSDGVPNDRWVYSVWSFLQEEYERLADPQTTTSTSPANEQVLVRAFLQPLQDWCLIPAKTLPRSSKDSQKPHQASSRSPTSQEDTVDHYLVSVRLAETIVDYSQASIMSNPARQCFGKIGVPELNCALLDGTLIKKTSGGMASINQQSGSAGFVKLIVATPEQPKAILSALEHATATIGGKQNLAMEDCYTILKYFSDSLDLWESDDKARSSLRNLALHITVQNSVVRLGDTPAYFLQDDLPETEMDSWQAEAGVIFLRADSQFARLYNTLDCAALSATQVYVAHLFHAFDKFSEKGRLAHLTFIRDYKLPQVKDAERSSFLKQLSKLAFIPRDDGKLEPASRFFDPDHQVFQVMLKNKPGSFPPGPFSDFSWLEFLRVVGLQKDLTVALFVKFASEVAEQAKRAPPGDELLNQSRTLVVHLLKMENLTSLNLLQQIRDIPFIPAARASPAMRRMYPAHGENQDRSDQTYIRFKDGIPEEFALLVWTSTYLLPAWANPYRQKEPDVSLASNENLDKLSADVAEILSVQEHPSMELVVEHIQNICSVPMSKEDDTLEMRGFVKMDVMRKVYDFLQTKLAESTAHDGLHKMLHRLAETPCVVSDAGRIFVKPKQVVINLYEEDQIHPYLIQAPTELGEYKRLFLHLGATLHATADQYAGVLESIHHQTGGEKLHPNELRLAFKAVRGMFATLQRQRHSDPMAHVHALHLPTKHGHLHRSTEVVFNDDHGYSERIKQLSRPFLVDLSECKIVAENYEDIVKLLPPRLRPIMLSSIVHEVLEEKSRETLMLHPVADKLKYQLNSKAFFQGLMRLVKHEHKKAGQRIRQTIIDSIEQHLKKIHVYGVDKLVTYLSYESQRISGSESECQCFVDRRLDEDSGTETWNVVISKTTCLSEELQVSVAESINKIIGGLLNNSVHYIQPILSCVPHSIPKILDRLKVRSDQHQGMDFPTLPTAGTLIPKEDHHLLKDDFEEFEAGEYVGFEIDDDVSRVPTVVYAVILERIQEDNFDSPASRHKISESDHMDQTHNRLTQKYHVNVGDERLPIIALSTDLYKFRRIEGLGRRGSMGGESMRQSWSSQQSPGANVSKPNFRDSFKSSLFEPDSASRRRRLSSARSDQLDGSTYEEYTEEYFQDDDGTPTPTKSPGPFSFDRQRSSGSRASAAAAENFTTELMISEDSGFRRPQLTNQPPRDPNLPPLTREEEQRQQELSEVEKSMEEVSDTLEEAWRMPEAQRKKIIKRLMLKWHPDKNIGQEAFATVITQHIQAELERLELGLPRPSHFDPTQFDFDPRNPFSGTSSFQQNFANAYKFFFEQMNQRAKEHKEQRERYQDNYGQDSDSAPGGGGPGAQPAQARRFLRQAQEDLRSADNDYEASDPAYEWACFKAHQAAEKALKAAQYAVDAVTSFSHDLAVLAASLEDVELRRLAVKLQKIVGNSNKLYNPDPIDFLVIPHEEYSKEMACDAVMCAVDILERVKEFVELRDSA